MSELKRQVSIWRLVGDLKMKDLVWPSLVLAIPIGGGAAYVLISVATLQDRISVASDYLYVSGALVAVTFAALALVMGFMSESYVRWLNRGDQGVLPFLSPFVVAIAIQVMTLLGVIMYRAFASHVGSVIEQWFFGIVSVLLVYVLADIVGLAKLLLAHGITRARAIGIDDEKRRREGGNDGGPNLRAIKPED